MFNIPADGWIALAVWGFVIFIPWVYSSYLIYRINKTGVERWGASKPKESKFVETEVEV